MGSWSAMADNQDLSEDYILELLKKDAKKVSASYNRSGTYDVLPKRPVGAAPKPNTRFLKNIIQNTDNHNAALKMKELSDAGRRLRAMAKEQAERTNAGSKSGQRDNFEMDNRERSSKRKRDSRRRYDSQDRKDHKRSRVRRRNTSSEEEASSYYSNREASSSRSRSPKVRSRRKRSSSVDSHTEYYRRHRDKPREPSVSRNERKRGRHTSDGDKSRNRESSPPRSKVHRHTDHHDKRQHDDYSKHSKRRRSRSRERDGHKRRHRRRSYSSERESDIGSRSRSKLYNGTKKDRNRRPSKSSAGSPSSKTRKERSPSLALHKLGEDDDEDPLTSFLGPKLPSKVEPPQIRGRGTTAFSSGIEERFSSTYDPTLDLHPESNTAEDEDWDLALEALRDRQKFKQAGADRLLAAGFSKEEVERMERGGERNEDDVRWSKKGEAREWDRGKVMDENGYVSVDGDKFGRLT